MTPAASRLVWIDIAKGLCLIAVVTLYTTTHVTEGLGRTSWMQAWVAFAQPFRMPDFFFVSGLLLGRVIDRPWRPYLDRKVLHYLWFFVVWSLLYFVLRLGAGQALHDGRSAGEEFVKSMTWGPFAMLWFLQMLPVYLVLTKLLRRIPWPAVLFAAAVWHWLPIDTPWTQIDRAGERFVFFFAGYALAAPVERFAGWVQRRPGPAWALIAAWALGNGVLVAGGWAAVHPLPLLLGLAGALGVIAVAVQLQGRAPGRLLAHLGAQSLPIFVGFFLPMAALTRVWLTATWGTSWRDFDAGVLALLLAAASIATALAAERLARGTRLAWFYDRPAWARLREPSAPREAAQPVTPAGSPHEQQRAARIGGHPQEG
jgi:uncharacterized membrane protein YcfT